MLEVQLTNQQPDYVGNGLGLVGLVIIMNSVGSGGNAFILGVLLCIASLLSFFNRQKNRNVILNRITALEAEILKLQIEELG